MVTVRVRRRDMVVPILFLIIVDGAILLAWQLMAPLVWRRTVTDWDEKLFAPKKSYGECMSREGSIDSWFFLGPILAIHVIVLIVGNIMAYKSRNIATSFHEGKWITIAMFGNLEALVIAFPIIIIVSNLPSASLFVRSAVVFLNDFGILICIFMPKILNLAAVTTEPAASTVVTTLPNFTDSGNSGNSGNDVVNDSAPMPQMASKRDVDIGSTSGSPMRQKKKSGAAVVPTPFVNSIESYDRTLSDDTATRTTSQANNVEAPAGPQWNGGVRFTQTQLTAKTATQKTKTIRPSGVTAAGDSAVHSTSERLDATCASTNVEHSLRGDLNSGLTNTNHPQLHRQQQSVPHEDANVDGMDSGDETKRETGRASSRGGVEEERNPDVGGYSTRESRILMVQGLVRSYRRKDY